jgi:hypothetical protein
MFSDVCAGFAATGVLVAVRLCLVVAATAVDVDVDEEGFSAVFVVRPRLDLTCASLD